MTLTVRRARLNKSPPPQEPLRLLRLGELADATAARLRDDDDAARVVTSLAPLERAGPDSVAMFDGSVDVDQLLATRAGACFVMMDDAMHVPSGTAVLVTEQPRRAFQRAASLLLPGMTQRAWTTRHEARHPTSIVDHEARLERDVTIGPGAVIGPNAEIGAGSVIGAHAVLGAGVCVGRGCVIEAGASVLHALIGDRVVIHAGASIGSAQPAAHDADGRTPQLGRVIIQDDAEIGANSVVRRGNRGDTVVGEGSAVESLTLVHADQVIDRHTIVRGG